MPQHYRDESDGRTRAPTKIIPIVRDDQDDPQAHEQAAKNGEDEQHAVAAPLRIRCITRADAFGLIGGDQALPHKLRQHLGDPRAVHRAEDTGSGSDGMMTRILTSVSVAARSGEKEPNRKEDDGRPGILAFRRLS